MHRGGNNMQKGLKLFFKVSWDRIKEDKELFAADVVPFMNLNKYYPLY
jgi:hypothetical protein